MVKVLVIVVTYNGMKWLDKCLSSILNSSIKVDCFVIDNNSTDDSPTLVKDHYSQFFFYQSDTNLGFGKANNIGLQKAISEGYDYVLLLNQDAWLEQDTIELLIQTIHENKEYGIISPLQYNSFESNIESSFNKYLIKNNININNQQLQQVDFVNAAIWLISREAIELVGAFDPIFPHYGEDNDYVYRLYYWGKKIGVDTSIKGYHDRATPPITGNKEYNIDIKRLEIRLMCVLNNINHTLINRCFLASKILIRKVIKYLFCGNLRMVYKYLFAYCWVFNNLQSIKISRSKTIIKGAYIQ